MNYDCLVVSFEGCRSALSHPFVQYRGWVRLKVGHQSKMSEGRSK